MFFNVLHLKLKDFNLALSNSLRSLSISTLVVAWLSRLQNLKSEIQKTWVGPKPSDSLALEQIYHDIIAY